MSLFENILLIWGAIGLVILITTKGKGKDWIGVALLGPGVWCLVIFVCFIQLAQGLFELRKTEL